MGERRLLAWVAQTLSFRFFLSPPLLQGDTRLVILAHAADADVGSYVGILTSYAFLLEAHVLAYEYPG